MLSTISHQIFTYTRGVSPKRVTSGGGPIRGLAPGLHSPEETSQRWRTVGDKCADWTGPGIEPQTSRTDSVRSATCGRFGFDSLVDQIGHSVASGFPPLRRFFCVAQAHSRGDGPRKLITRFSEYNEDLI